MRDSALWNTPEGAAVRWTRMGEGNMGMEDYIRTYIEKCPGKAVSLEVIVSGNPRMFNYRDPKFWELFKGNAGLGVLAVPDALRQGQADARGAAGSGDDAAGSQRRRRRSERRVDAGVSGEAVNRSWRRSSQLDAANGRRTELQGA